MEADNYAKNVAAINKQTAKQQTREKVKRYLADNWIAIVALILSIIALLKP